MLVCLMKSCRRRRRPTRLGRIGLDGLWPGSSIAPSLSLLCDKTTGFKSMQNIIKLRGWELKNTSPVDVAVSIRKDLAEFQRISSKEKFRAELHAAYRGSLLQAASCQRSRDSVPGS